MNNVYLVTLNSAPYVTPFLPYVYGLLRVYAEADPLVAQAYTFKEPFFLLAQPAKIVEKLEQPAVLGLSCYIWNFRRHMKVARLTKARYPHTLVVAGGPQIPDRVEDFFEQHPYVDLLVHGEGERPFQALLRERLAEVPDWSRVLASNRPLWLEAKERAVKGPGVLLATNVAGHSPATVIESVLAVALTLRGARVETLVCAGLGLPGANPAETRPRAPAATAASTSAASAPA